MLPAHLAREMVIGPLEFGFADGEDLVAVAKFDEILVRAAAEDGLTDQECQSQFKLEAGRAHSRHEPTLLRRECQDRLAVCRKNEVQAPGRSKIRSEYIFTLPPYLSYPLG